MNSIKANIEKVMENVEKAAIRSGRTLEDITVVGVTKTQSVESINEAIDAGIKVAGENKVQELLDKYGKTESVSWHLIGHLQTNKVKYIIDKVDLIHSVDSIKLLDEIDKQSSKINKYIDVLLQVNISGEESKFGVAPDEICNILEHCVELNNTKVVGLMTVAPNIDSSVTNILHFRNLYNIYIDIKNKKYDNVSMRYLSMGMSGDYIEAIEAGANIVRIGSMIFGQRNYIL